MSVTNSKSSTYKIKPRTRTIHSTFPPDHLCRYFLSGNRRCQRIQGVTGSGLCILHDRQLNQLRDAESRSLGQEALGNVADFNSAISIHAVLSRVVILGLQRRYSTKEVAVFTYAIQALRQTLDESAHELRHFHGLNASDPYIARALANEPSLRRPRQRTAQSPIGVGLGRDSGQTPPTQIFAKPQNPATSLDTTSLDTTTLDTTTINANDIADVLHSGYVSNRSAESVENLLKRSPETLSGADNSRLESIRSGLSRLRQHLASANATTESAQSPLSNGNDAVGADLESAHASVGASLAPPAATSTPIAPQTTNRATTPRENKFPANEDLNDDSVPYTHMQSYGGITVPLTGRLHGAPKIEPSTTNSNTTQPTPRPVKFFRGKKPNR